MEDAIKFTLFLLITIQAVKSFGNGVDEVNYGTISEYSGRRMAAQQAGSMSLSGPVWRRLSATVLRYRYEDSFGENPLLYVIHVPQSQWYYVIDTGTGVPLDFYDILAQRAELSGRRPVVINTHNHFDHVGGNHQFPSGTAIWASGADKGYTLDPFNTMDWYVKYRVGNYTVTRWLDDNEVVDLRSDAGGGSPATLTVLQTPGHTPDSMCLYYVHGDERTMFTGDTLYPDNMLALTPHADLDTYVRSLEKLRDFIDAEESPSAGGGNAGVQLACAHASDSVPSSFVGSALSFFKKVQSGEERPVQSDVLTNFYMSPDSEGGWPVALAVTRFKWLQAVYWPICRMFRSLCVK